MVGDVRFYAFDFETFPIAPGRLAPTPVCVAISDGQSEELVACPLGLERLAELLGDPDVVLVAHNAAFDLAVMCDADPDRFFPLVYSALEAGRIWCTRVREMLRKIRLGRFHFCPVLNKRNPSFSLAECVLERFGRDRSDEKKSPDSWRLRYGELYGVSVSDYPDAAREYPLDDVRDCLALALAQQNEPEGCFTESVRHSFACFLLSARGVRTDGASVAALEARLRAIVAKSEAELVAAGILRENGSQDVKRTRELVAAALGDAAPRTEKGAIQTNEATLRASGDPRLLLLADIRADRDELARYVPILRDGSRFPINASFRVLVESYRTSCRRPNLQNQPRRSGVRECYVARPGFVWIAADYSIAELRSLAQTCLDWFDSSEMANELRAGRDLHLVIAAELLGAQERRSISYAEIVERHSAGDKSTKNARQMAKAANFGFPGGLGADAFCRFAAGYGLKLTEDEATDIRSRWLDRFPEMAQYFREIGKRVGAGGGSFTYVDERTGFVRGAVRFTDGCNHAFQHRTAAGAKDALSDVVRECYLGECSRCRGSGLWVDSRAELAVGCECPPAAAAPAGPLFGSFPVAFIHDEIIIEAPETKATAAAARLEAIMVRAMRRYVPDVPILVDSASMRRWYKNAEEVRSESGELLAWEPGS